MSRNSAQRPTVNIFAQQAKINIPRSTFNRSNDRWHTFNVGELVPVFVDEVLPGDTFKMELSTFARLSTPLFPTMDTAMVDYHTFFVPNRLIWNNWQKFMGEQDNPGDSIAYAVPQVNMSGLPSQKFQSNTIYDDMGYPTNVQSSAIYPPNNLAARAYTLIFNQWYRDQNYQNSVTSPKDDGPDLANNMQNRLFRNTRPDYFTSGLPTCQKFFNGNGVPFLSPEYNVLRHSNAPTAKLYQQGTDTLAANGAVTSVTGQLAANGTAVSLDPNGGLYVNHSFDTINTLRQAFQMQQFLETDNRGGTRYIELIRAHFNVINPDFRLQRPEFIHGKTVPLNITPVANTATDTGKLTGFGTSGSNSKFIKSFTEHGIIMTIASVRLNQSYQNGFDKMHLRNTRYDYFWPEFAHLGEQIIQLQELQADPSKLPAFNAAGISFQERYAEYRYKNNLVANQFKSTPFLTNALGSLSAWHYADELNSTGLAIDAGFISTQKQVATMNRTLSVSSTVAPQIIHNTFINLECTRPMPVHGIPQSLLRL